MTILEMMKLMNDCQAKGICEDKEALKSGFDALKDEEKEAVQNQFDAVQELPVNNDAEVDSELKNAMKEANKEGMEKIQSGLEKKLEDQSDDVKKLVKSEMEKMKNESGAYNKEVSKSAIRKMQNEALRNCLTQLSSGKISEINGEVFKNAMTTDRDASPFTGYNTDDTFDFTIRHLITEYGVAAREFTTLTLNNSSYNTRELVTDIAAGWIDEGGVFTSGQIVLGKKNFSLKKLGVISYFTTELLQEQQIDLMSFIGQRVAENFAKKEDEAFLIGDGTSTYGSFTGLLQATGVNEVDMAVNTGFGDITPQSLVDLQLGTPTGVGNPKYVMHRTVWSKVVNYRVDAVSAGDAAGGYLFNPTAGVVNTRDERSFQGYPVVLSEVVPAVADTAADTAFVLFGDFKQSAIRGIRGGIRVLESRDAVVKNEAGDADVNMFTTDREAIRWSYQVGYLAVLPKESSNVGTKSSMTRLVTGSVSA